MSTIDVKVPRCDLQIPSNQLRSSGHHLGTTQAASLWRTLELFHGPPTFNSSRAACSGSRLAMQRPDPWIHAHVLARDPRHGRRCVCRAKNVGIEGGGGCSARP